MIEFKNVKKTYPNGTHALNGVNLRVEDGEFVFVVGHSGAGKSTMMKLLLREETLTTGRLMLDRYDLTKMSRFRVPYYRRELGVVFQDFRLFPNKTVYENVAFAMWAVGTPGRMIRRRVPAILNTVNLSDKQKCFPRELSGGEQQRVALARAILKDAPIVVLDEATAFADPENEAMIQKAFATLTKDRTVIMIAHRLSTVVGADKIIVLDNGKVSEEGTHTELVQANGLYSRMWKEYNQAVKWRITQAEPAESVSVQKEVQ